MFNYNRRGLQNSTPCTIQCLHSTELGVHVLRSICPPYWGHRGDCPGRGRGDGHSTMNDLIVLCPAPLGKSTIIGYLMEAHHIIGYGN